MCENDAIMMQYEKVARNDLHIDLFRSGNLRFDRIVTVDISDRNIILSFSPQDVREYGHR